MFGPLRPFSAQAYAAPPASAYTAPPPNWYSGWNPAAAAAWGWPGYGMPAPGGAKSSSANKDKEVKKDERKVGRVAAKSKAETRKAAAEAVAAKLEEADKAAKASGQVNGDQVADEANGPSKTEEKKSKKEKTKKSKGTAEEKAGKKDKEKGKDEDRSRSRKKGDSQRDKSKSRKEVTSQEAGAEDAAASKDGKQKSRRRKRGESSASQSYSSERRKHKRRRRLKNMASALVQLLFFFQAGPETVNDAQEDTAQTPQSEVQPLTLQHLKDDRWVINLLYDGDCPSCMKQVEFLQKRMDENPEYEGLVALTNLHAPDYDPELCGGDGMRHIHAVTRDGEVIAGMDVFRRIYSIVGMQWVYEITTLPFVGAFFDWLYDWFSEYRLKAAGREDILEKVHSHQAKIQDLEETECEDECEVDWDQLAVPKFSKMSPGR
eukprot:s2120_g19.t1